MAIIAELITLWRLQTCVISIFPSSHLACCLENASIGRVNLATAQPSPFSPATLLQTLPVLVLSLTSQVLLCCWDTFPALPAAPSLSAAFGHQEFPPEAAELGQAGWAWSWQVLLLPVQMAPLRSQRQFSDK